MLIYDVQRGQRIRIRLLEDQMETPRSQAIGEFFTALMTAIEEDNPIDEISDEIVSSWPNTPEFDEPFVVIPAGTNCEGRVTDVNWRGFTVQLDNGIEKTFDKNDGSILIFDDAAPKKPRRSKK